MLPSRKEVENEIAHSAREWRLEPCHAFCKKVVDLAIESLQQPSLVQEDWNEAYQTLKQSRLPEARSDAVSLVLEKELGGARGTFTVAKDKLDMNFQPFFRSDDGEYYRKRAYQRISLHALDPFERFTGHELGPKDYYHKIWHDGKNFSLDGTIFEAIVAHYMEYHMACKHCKGRRTLRWNGGLGVFSSWSDVVCLECHSTYEIRSKADIEKVDKDFQNNNFRGGSFKTYCKYHPHLQSQEDGKRYCVVVCRAASFNRNARAMTHRVSIGEIEKVSPRLVDRSFVNSSREVQISSEVSLKRDTVDKVWCHIPEYRADFLALAKAAYETEFGVGMWDSLSPPEVTPPVKQTEGAITDEVSSVRVLLEQLKVGSSSDDWDDLYDSD